MLLLLLGAGLVAACGGGEDADPSTFPDASTLLDQSATRMEQVRSMHFLLEHENGAISNLTASYASASEYYMMNIYGKDASAYYDLFGGLRLLKRGEDKPVPVPAATARRARSSSAWESSALARAVSRTVSARRHVR